MGSMIQEQVRKIVIEGYVNILKRWPDKGGMSHYSEMLNNDKLTPEQFYDILLKSDEYKEKFGSVITVPSSIYLHKSLQNIPNINTDIKTEPVINTDIKTDTQNILTYCMIGGNKLHEIKDYIPTVLPYVDMFVYIDSYSTDGTVEFMKDLSEKNNNKIIVITKEWQDKFAYFRNFYLEYLKGINYDGWVLVSDTDEHFPIETLYQLRNLIKESEDGISYNGLEFRSYDVLIDDNDRTKIMSEKLSNYWKGLMFKFHPSIRYQGEPHESFTGISINWKRTDIIYKHIRSQRKIYERSVENFFISNSNRYSAKWSEFRFLCTKTNILTFEQFEELYNKGKLSKDIEDWIYNHRNDNQDDGDSEVREMAKLYYEILHPDKLKNITN